jgi:hypothetical protein
MFAFSLRVVQAVEPRMAFDYLVKKYSTVSRETKSFTDALSRPRNTKYFGKNADGLYYLHEAGERAVEAWIGGAEPTGGSDEGDTDEDQAFDDEAA